MGLEVNDLTVRLYSGKKNRDFINVADSVGLRVEAGKITSIVGESGSGKSFLGLSLLRLNPPRISEIVSGSIKVVCPGKTMNGSHKSAGPAAEELDIVKMPASGLPSVRGRLISMIFQDPNASLNPVMKIGDQIMEAIFAHKKVGRDKAEETAISFLNYMNIDGKARFNSYPHELSGGQRQRVMIAMALVLNPCVLIADEPTTALDVTTSIQVLGLIEKVKAESGVGVLFITHDLGLARNISDSIYVFYAGEVMEYGSAEDIVDSPLHPYTVSLIKSVPFLSREYIPGQKLFTIPGYLSREDFKGEKCRFYSRCFKKDGDCLKKISLEEIVPGRFVRCIKAR